jgi:hypothetical protein
MDAITFVKTSLKYFDENSEKYENVLKHAKYVKYIESENDTTHNVIELFDKDKNKIFSSRYEIIGLHNNDSNTWTWSWAIPFFRKNNTNIARQLWNYGAMLDPDVKYLKSELITSRFRIADHIQVDIHIAIASYMSKIPFIFKYVYHAKNTKMADDQETEHAEYRKFNIDTTDSILIYYLFLLDFDKI